MLPRRLRFQIEGRWLGARARRLAGLATVQRALAQFVDRGGRPIVFGHSHGRARREGDVLLSIRARRPIAARSRVSPTAGSRSGRTGG